MKCERGGGDFPGLKEAGGRGRGISRFQRFAENQLPPLRGRREEGKKGIERKREKKKEGDSLHYRMKRGKRREEGRENFSEMQNFGGGFFGASGEYLRSSSLAKKKSHERKKSSRRFLYLAAQQRERRKVDGRTK